MRWDFARVRPPRPSETGVKQIDYGTAKIYRGLTRVRRAENVAKTVHSAILVAENYERVAIRLTALLVRGYLFRYTFASRFDFEYSVPSRNK